MTGGILGLLLLLAPLAAQTRQGEPPKPPARPKQLTPPSVPASAPREQAKPEPAKPDPQPPAAPPAASTPAAEPAGPTESGCLRALTAIAGNRIRPPRPEAVKSGDAACQVEDPVSIEALALSNATGTGQIVFDPPVTVACAMASTLATWLDGSLQPLVRGHFGQDLTRLRVGGGFECRRRNRASAGPISEHATGRALDIFAFVVGDEKAGGFKVVVEKPEGLVQNRFLQAARNSACGAFTTALGPGSDAAHANHLHLDIQQRRSASTRFCQ